MKGVPISLALAAVFTALTYFWACNPGRPWWRKKDLVTDLCYWFFIPLLTRYLRIGMLVAGAAVLFGITTADGLIAFYENGHGPLAALPLVAQMVIFLVGEDLITYWTHRLVPRRASCGNTTPCIIPRKNWNGSRRRASIRSICFSARCSPTSFSCSPASRRTCSSCSDRSPSRIRPLCTPISTGRSARSNTSSPRRSSIAGITPRRTAAARRTLPRRSRSST